MPKIAIAILAAGQASRFGSPKQLACLNDGRTLLQRAIDVASEVAVEPPWVVLGAYVEAIKPAIQHARIIENIHWHSGMGSSIACVTDRVEPLDVDGVLFVLADQVALAAGDLWKIVEAFSSEHIVCADYSTASNPSILGVPALFPRSCFEQLRRLRGDQGARVLLDGSVLPVVSISLPRAKLDIDTPEALAEFNLDL